MFVLRLLLLLMTVMFHLFSDVHTVAINDHMKLNLKFDANYDKSTITYDPSGRIIQLEKAYEIVNRGSNSIAIKMNDYILILTWTDAYKDKMIIDIPSKLHKLCDNMGIFGKLHKQKTI